MEVKNIQEVETDIPEEKEEKRMSKKSKFLIGAGIIGGIAAIAGIVISKKAKKSYVPVDDYDDDDIVIKDLDDDDECEDDQSETDPEKTE